MWCLDHVEIVYQSLHMIALMWLQHRMIVPDVQPGLESVSMPHPDVIRQNQGTLEARETQDVQCEIRKITAPSALPLQQLGQKFW